VPGPALVPDQRASTCWSPQALRAREEAREYEELKLFWLAGDVSAVRLVEWRVSTDILIEQTVQDRVAVTRELASISICYER
jgi:hypothetical protein